MRNKDFKQDRKVVPPGDIYWEVNNLAKIFYLFSIVALLTMLAGIFIVLTTHSNHAAITMGLSVLPILCSVYLAHRGNFDAAATFLAATLILVNTLLSTRGLGIHHISNLAYPAILIIASLITKKWMQLFLLVLTVLCIAWLVFGELFGLYSPSVLVHSVPGDFFSAAVIVIATAILAHNLTNFLYKGFSMLQKEVIERREAENNLRQREAILEAATFAAEKFLKSSNWRESIDEVLERFGKTINATHAYLFEHHVGVNNEQLDSLRYEWTAPGYTSDLENPEFQNSSFNNEGFDSYYKTLIDGEPFAGNTSTFAPAELEFFASQGIKSILEVPLFVNGQWWGTVGFDDFENIREWNLAELDGLKIAADILGAAIQREKTDSAVQESERIYRQAIEAAGAVPYYQDYKKNQYVFIGSGIEKMIGYKPDEFTPQLWNEITKENIPLGDGTGLQIPDLIDRVRSGNIRAWQTDVRVRLPNGEDRWLNDSAVELFDDAAVSYASIGILQDVTDRKLAEFHLKKHESLLEAVTFSAGQFLKTGDWREKIDVVLERLGSEFGASHAYLFQRHFGENGEMLSSMIHEWTAPNCETDLGSPEFQDMLPSPMGFDRLYQILDSGEPLVGSASFFTAEEKEYMHSINVKALLEIRVMVNGEPWGTLGVDDISSAREWTSMEVDVIRLASGMLGTAIERQLNDDMLKHELMERRRAENALRFSEEKFSKAFHTTPVLMTIEDRNGRFIEVNNAFLETFGLQRDDAVGYKASELGVFQNSEDTIALRREFSEKGFLKDFELRFQRTKHGDTGFALLSSEKFYVDNAMYTLTSALDITERKQAEVEREKLISDLKLKNAEAETIRETTAIVTSTLDISEAVNRILEQLNRVVAYDSASVWLYEGKVARLVGGVGLPELTENDKIYTVAENEPDYIFWTQDTPYILFDDIQNYYPQFPDFLHGWLSIPLKVRGKLIGFIALDGHAPSQFNERDAQQALIYAAQVSIALENARLFSDVQNQLNERQKLINELENKNSELERFTYTVSHDLKSPLVTISGFLGYLEQDAAAGKTERLKNDVQRIQEAVHKMQILLSELLELSRIGRMVNAPQVVPFEDLIDEAKEIVYGRLEANHVTLLTHPGLPAVYGDKPRLIEILQNLIDNAAKYMGDQPEPLIEIGQQGEEDGKSIFFIRDNGIGIEPAHHERIFGLFEKLDTKSEGTGVGLALVKRIIEVHGGRIWVESIPRHGSVFYFTLPKPVVG